MPPNKARSTTGSACLGAHMSVAGGLETGIARALEAGCSCLQVFTKNNNQWACKPLTDQQVDAWRTAWADSKLVHPIAHASYLINLATPDALLWQKSVDALVVELRRAEQLGLEALVVHPGAYTTSSEAEGLQRVADAVVRVRDEMGSAGCRLLLENTAGQGSCLGHSFGQLGWLVRRIDAAAAVGVCFDTCHAFAAGYELNTPAGFRAMMRELDAELPAGIIAAVHLNDSKKPCGSRVDRHEHIGRGCIGADGFRLVLADPQLGKLPGYLETPKGEDAESHQDWDRVNLAALRELASAVA